MGFFETIGNGYKIMGQEAKCKISENRANIWTGVSVIGTVAAAVASWFGGMKSARQIDAKENEVGRALSAKEKAKLCWKNVLLPAGAVIGSGAGAVTSNRIQAGNIARLTTDVAVVTKAYNEFKKATNEVVNEKQQAEIKDHIAEQKREEINPEKLNQIQEPMIPGTRMQLYKEEVSGITFFSNNDRILRACAEAQNEMKSLPPRTYACKTQRLGVTLKKILRDAGATEATDPRATSDVVIMNDYGFNKGYWKDGVDDDDTICCYLAPGETMYQGEMRSCYVIMWDTEPSDMRLAYLTKSSEAIS